MRIFSIPENGATCFFHIAAHFLQIQQPLPALALSLIQQFPAQRRGVVKGGGDNALPASARHLQKYPPVLMMPVGVPDQRVKNYVTRKLSLGLARTFWRRKPQL